MIEAEIKIQDMEFVFEDCLIHLSELNNNQSTYHTKLITILFPFTSFDNIDNTYLKGLNIAEKITDRISLLGYCRTLPPLHIITTIEKCKANVEFKVLLTQGIKHTRTYSCEITKHDIESFNKISIPPDSEHYLESALSLFRKALSTSSLEEKILMLSTCLEKISSEETTDFVIKKCQKCGFEENTNTKASKKHLKKLLKNKGVNAKDINNFIDRDRNKIVHGGGKRNQKFYSDLKESLIKIQHIIAEILKEKLNANIVNATTSIIDLPKIVYTITKTSAGYDIINDSNFSALASISTINNTSIQSNQCFTCDIGLWMSIDKNPIYDPMFIASFFPLELTSNKK